MEPAPLPTPRASGRLRAMLVGLDALAVAAAWLLTLVVPAAISGGEDLLRALAGVAVVTLASLAVIAAQGLYRARTCAVRAVEVARLGRAAAVSGVVSFVLADWLGLSISVADAVLGAFVGFVLLTALRGTYRAWLRRERTRGRYCRQVVMVGAGDETIELSRLFEQHPELGYRVAGLCGPRAGLAGSGVTAPWLGEVSETSTALRDAGVNGVVLAVSDLGYDELNVLIRELLRDDVHVHLSSGLRRVGYRRVRPLPMAHEPLFYVEPVGLAHWQLVVKRLLDLVIASVLLVVTLPILVLAALAVKIVDGGPVLFRQTRVGVGRTGFTLLKLRTMVPDAEDRLREVHAANQREGGPLFKFDQDPRRTRVGAFLERTSIDELPQLWNVLRGEMSLVGPRPALPHEVAQFDDELLDRLTVLPGITGLWQVEGRDHDAFDVYRRLDLFYVENWSLGLDLAIMFATAVAVAGRILRSLLGWGPREPTVLTPPGPEVWESATNEQDVPA